MAVREWMRAREDTSTVLEFIAPCQNGIKALIC